jgi:hypothetical protein
MMPSRGMGDINPSKMPKAKTITRKDDPNKFSKGFQSWGQVSGQRGWQLHQAWHEKSSF